MPTEPSVQEQAGAAFAHHLRGVASFAETYTESALERERSVAKLGGIFRKLTLITDQEISKIHQAMETAGSRVDCKAGCSSCCFRSVPVSIAEAVAIASHVESRFSPDERRDLAKRAAAYAKSNENCMAEDPLKCRAACPFLVNDLCSIYGARPINCRGANSVDVSKCVQRKEHPQTPVHVPSVGAQDSAASATSYGLRAGLLFEALDQGHVDLGLAIGVLLDNPAAAENYLAGGNAFQCAEVALVGDPLAQEDIGGRFLPAFQSERSIKEPTGRLTPADSTSLNDFYELIDKENKYKDAFRTLNQNFVVHRLARLVVPCVYRSAADIEEWRAAYETALRELASENLDPALAFTAFRVDVPAALTSQGRNNKELLQAHGRFVCDMAARALPDLASPVEPRKKGGKVRVGLISANMQAGVPCAWAVNWLGGHSDNIETFALNIGPVEDHVTRLFKRGAHHYFHLLRNLPENARFIRSLGLDVLVYPDLGTNGLHTLYSALRLAPVQCAARGGQETSGLPTINCFLSAADIEPKDGAAHYSEKLVALPGLGAGFLKAELSPPKRSRSDFDLPENRALILCLQDKARMLPQEDALYAEVARAANAPIVLMETNPPGETLVVKKRMADAGVRTHWLPLMPDEDVQALVKLADVALDGPTWNCPEVALDALSVGVPVVTRRGEFMRGRQTAAVLERAGAGGLVAKDDKDYVALAADFARQKKAMASLNLQGAFDHGAAIAALDEFLLSC